MIITLESFFQTSLIHFNNPLVSGSLAGSLLPSIFTCPPSELVKIAFIVIISPYSFYTFPNMTASILLPKYHSRASHNTVTSTFSVLLILISLFFLYICDLDIVAQLLKHLDEYLVDDAVLLVYEPADVRCGSVFIRSLHFSSPLLLRR